MPKYSLIGRLASLFILAILVVAVPANSLASPTIVASKKQDQLPVVGGEQSEPGIEARRCASRHDERSIKVKMVVNASPQNVWKAICDTRTDDPDVKFSKITKISETQRLLEQKYVSLPFLGSTTCVLHISEDPGKRIDYELVKSDHLSEFAGTWILTQGEDGKSTIVEVSNHIKLKFPLPQKIVDGFAHHKLKSRVQMVKNTAEAHEVQLVQAPESAGSRFSHE